MFKKKTMFKKQTMLKKQIIMISVVLGFSFITASGIAGWQDWAKQADDLLKGTSGQEGAANTVSSSLSNTEISQGLKEALDLGVKKAIDMLGQENGFLNDQSVRIPMPDKLQQAEKLLRSVGQDKMADEFVTSMNRAAEQAVPKVTNVFVDSISNMTVSDAQGVLTGPDTAATDYFRKNTSEELSQLIKPYVSDAMNQTQVTQYYKSMLSQVKRYDSLGLAGNYLGSPSEIDDYVTDKTLDGLFTKIAVEEQLIRQNPAARSTELLKEVFGSIK
ncbi:MAG: DUF4197 domain-containing protein [Gammaproteobacteria bacterium]|nr:DUF4197 domain-containing protein [Gammaproteobacteria bacterium]